MKKVVSLLLICVSCFCNFPLPSSAQDMVPQYTNAEKKSIYTEYTDHENMLDILFNDSSAIGYWNVVDNIKKNTFSSVSIDLASMIIDEYPDKQKYAEILANLIMMQSGDLAEQVASQSQFDNLKDGLDYAMDVADIATSFIGGAELLETISPIIDAASDGAGVVIDNIDQAKYYQTTIQDYSQAKLFLEAVRTYASNDELKRVADSLMKANDSLLEKRLEYLSDTAATLANYDAKFFMENLSFDLLKTADLYKSDETVKWFVDCGSDLADSVLSMYSIGQFAFHMTMLAGNIGFGTANTFNRYQEMKVLVDIANALVEANRNIPTPVSYSATDALDVIQTKCNYYKMLITTHARGEYLAYQLMVNDAGMLSDFKVIFDSFKDPDDTMESWYNRQINIMTQHYDFLINLFEDINTDSMVNMEMIPTDAVELNGHYYYVYHLNTVTTWEEAKEYCESVGGYLATITSPEEDEFVYAYLRDNFDYESAYFGFTDRNEEGTWVWDNGEVGSYTNWHVNEPNREKPSEDFAMYYEKYSDGSWNDGDFGSGSSFICEWDADSTNLIDQPQQPVRTTSDERDIVLVLDASGSMAGTPIEETQKAAANFVETVLQEDASIGVVLYEDGAELLSDFSMDETLLTETVTNISANGGTNIEAGLAEAQSMLNNSGAKKKIIILMSDGEPNIGKEGEELIAYADEIKQDDILIYTLGFFESLDGTKSSAQYLMEHLASDGCHYEVASASDLVFFFEDMADQINGQKYIYIRIACPVDVTVSYNGETLCSAEENLNTRTDFGTLTFEDSEDEADVSQDDRIKVLRLKDGAEYDVQIIGTGRGMMDYTIGFMDKNGDYSDFRRFEDVKITQQTVIDTVAAVSDESLLNIDEDGDGSYDLRLQAGQNGYGEEVKRIPWLYIALVGIVVIFVLILLVVWKVHKRKGNQVLNTAARFCGNCGAKLDDRSSVCGRCGTPVKKLMTTIPGGMVVDPVKRKKVKRRKLVLVLLVVIVVVIAAVNIVPNYVGYNGLLRKVMDAYADYDIDTLVSLSSDVYYYDEQDKVEAYFADTVGADLDLFETAVGHSYKLSYEVEEVYDMSNRKQYELMNELESTFPDFDPDLIENVVIADLTVIVTQGKKSINKNIGITITKENGELKLLYIN